MSTTVDISRPHVIHSGETTGSTIKEKVMTACAKRIGSVLKRVIGVAKMVVLAACGMTLVTTARAENHALILWIGQYGDPRANLPGIDLDAKAARGIAAAMGVAAPNITELKNNQLKSGAVGEAISALTRRIKQGDKVFVFYSGHGDQRRNDVAGGPACSEGIVAHDGNLYFDRDLEADLERLGAKASQVVMMNDSCFSGGASVKSFSKAIPKAYPKAASLSPAAAASAPQCGTAVNKGFFTKSLEVVSRRGANMLYIAAAAANQVSYASDEGSLATQAWARCIKDPAADKDNSGSINGDELIACAQAHVNVNGSRLNVQQTVTPNGTSSLVLANLDTHGSSGATRVKPEKVLQDISAGSDKAYTVKLEAAKSTLRMGQDYFEFAVETPRDGYLYIFQVGTAGDSINMLFPNKEDDNNRLAAGRHSFPRPSWALRSAGPAGNNYLMAYLSDEKTNFSDILKRAGVFSTLDATRMEVKSLVVESTRGRYGTSQVVRVTEVP